VRLLLRFPDHAAASDARGLLGRGFPRFSLRLFDARGLRVDLRASPQGRSIRANVGAELKGVSAS
jgi:hypothetical protein